MIIILHGYSKIKAIFIFERIKNRKKSAAILCRLNKKIALVLRVMSKNQPLTTISCGLKAIQPQDKGLLTKCL